MGIRKGQYCNDAHLSLSNTGVATLLHKFLFFPGTKLVIIKLFIALKQFNSIIINRIE